MGKNKGSQFFTPERSALFISVASLIVALIAIPASGFLSPEFRIFFGLDKPTSTPTPTPKPTFTQAGPINLTPDSDGYGGKITSWSKPAYNMYCELPDCDKTSKRMDNLTEGTVVTAICWTYGQLVITGTTIPGKYGYQDMRWVKLQDDGTYLPNTWFMRDKLSVQLPEC